MTKNETKCPNCMGGIIIEGEWREGWGFDSWETKCPRCKGSGTLKTESTMNND